MRHVITVVVGLTALAVGAVTAPGLAMATQGELVTLDQVPAPVRATLEREARRGALGEVTKNPQGYWYENPNRENWGGAVIKRREGAVYEAEITRGGKERYVQVAADGTVLKHESAAKHARREAKEERARAAQSQ